MRVSLGTAALIILPEAVGGGTTVQLVLSNDFCVVFPGCPPHPPPSTTVASGATFGIYVVALRAADVGFSRDSDYAGTVVFSSTDSLATLPGSYTFGPGDSGGHAFTAVLRTPGQQTITVSDAGGGPAPGTLVMTVSEGGPLSSVPISDGATLVLLIALALTGFMFVRRMT